MANLKTFLDRAAEADNFFLFLGDRLYSIDGNSNSTNRVVTPGGYSMGLVPTLPFYHFERFDDRINSAEIAEDSKTFVRERLNREVEERGRLTDEKKRIKTLDFVVYQFLPLLVSKNYETAHHVTDMILSGEADRDSEILIERARKELQEKLDRDFGTEVKGDNANERLREMILREERGNLRQGPAVRAKYSLTDLGIDAREITPSITGEITGHQPLAVLNKRVYYFEQTERAKKSDLSFKLNDRLFVARPTDITLSGINSELVNRTLQRTRISALERSGDFDLIKDAIQDTEKRQHQIAQLARLNEYDLGNCGFVLHGDNYCVYARIPQFATQDGRNPKVFWPFPSVKVGIYMGFNNGQAYSFDRPLVIDPMPNHPCLREKTRGYCDICNLNREPDSYNNTPQEILRKLSDAVNVIMHPMTPLSLEAHTGESYFGVTLKEILKQKPMTREQAEAEGFTIAEVIENSAAAEAKQGEEK